MKYLKKILDNGITIILAPVKENSIISMGFFVKAGSRNEVDENNGIAHFLEHMMFKGTKNRTSIDIFNELDSLGSIYNAATTAQYTYYYVYGDSSDTKKLLDIMLDIYINPDFETKEIEKEKKVIVEEMRMIADTPMMKLYSVLHQKMFKGTSLERTIIGTEQTVMSLKRRDFMDFRKGLYKPENTVFVITGNFNPVPIYKIVEKILTPLQNPDTEPVLYNNEKTIISKNMEEQSEPYVYVKRNNLFKQVYILLAFPLYNLYNTKHRELELLSHLLTSGFSSRLYRSLRVNNGITYSSNAYPIIYSDSGIFVIQLIMNPFEFTKGIKILMDELRKIKEELMTKEEMAKIQNYTKNEILFSSGKSTELLVYYGLNFLENRKFKPDVKGDLDKFKKITRAQIQKTAEEIFIRDKINLFIYGNIDITDFNFIDL